MTPGRVDKAVAADRNRNQAVDAYEYHRNYSEAIPPETTERLIMAYDNLRLFVNNLRTDIGTPLVEGRIWDADLEGKHQSEPVPKRFRQFIESMSALPDIFEDFN